MMKHFFANCEIENSAPHPTRALQPLVSPARCPYLISPLPVKRMEVERLEPWVQAIFLFVLRFLLLLVTSRDAPWMASVARWLVAAVNQWPYSSFRPFWLKSLFTLKTSCVFLFLFALYLERRRVMPRRGWQQFDVPSGLVRVLGGRGHHRRSGQLFTVQVPWAVVQGNPSLLLHRLPLQDMPPKSSSRAARQKLLFPRQ